VENVTSHISFKLLSMMWAKIIITIMVGYALSSFYRVVSFMTKKLYLITVKALYVVTFPIQNFISLQNFLIHFNFLLPQDVRVILCDGVPENNISHLIMISGSLIRKLWFISAQEDVSVISRYCHKINVVRSFPRIPGR
jgi:hypothetical protein